MKAGSAAKLIVDALLQRFLPLARRRIETAQAQVFLFSFLVHKKQKIVFWVRATVIVLVLVRLFRKPICTLP